jgi:hypothetical protein
MSVEVLLGMLGFGAVMFLEFKLISDFMSQEMQERKNGRRYEVKFKNGEYIFVKRKNFIF